jgi:hypothetical protein
MTPNRVLTPPANHTHTHVIIHICTPVSSVSQVAVFIIVHIVFTFHHNGHTPFLSVLSAWP